MQRNPRAAHAALIEYAPGTVIGGWRIIRRVRNRGNSNATWLCEHVACTRMGQKEIQGIVLRRKPPQFCYQCAPSFRGQSRLK